MAGSVRPRGGGTAALYPSASSAASGGSCKPRSPIGNRMNVTDQLAALAKERGRVRKRIAVDGARGRRSQLVNRDCDRIGLHDGDETARLQPICHGIVRGILNREAVSRAIGLSICNRMPHFIDAHDLDRPLSPRGPNARRFSPSGRSPCSLIHDHAR